MEIKDFLMCISLILYRGSMQPVLNKNDVIFVKKCNIEEIEVEDIISFIKDDEIITHRVIEIKEENKTIKYRTKGDNNEIRDNFLVEYSEIYGKMLFKIPKIGIIVEYIQNSSGIINFTILVLIIFIFINLNDKKKSIRKTKRRKYEIKKIRDNYN